ncbi:uncharacterized protein [Palaemon carinicauda]|uniref:uncharacterized protein n=1 Tax=Palaemon carinicauda TaxID=392227 RepID=UPI0035B5ABF6
MSSEAEVYFECNPDNNSDEEEASPEDIEDKKILEECRICFQKYTSIGRQKPKTLICNHTFCTMCLVYTISDGLLTCPTCQVSYKFPLEAQGTAPEESQVSLKNEIISRRKLELHFTHVQMEEELREYENRVEKLTKFKGIIGKKLQESKRNVSDENDFLCLLMVDERRFMSEVTEKMNKIVEKLKGVASKVNLAETVGEKLLLMEETAICNKGILRWQALHKRSESKLAEIYARVDEVSTTVMYFLFV